MHIITTLHSKHIQHIQHVNINSVYQNIFRREE